MSKFVCSSNVHDMINKESPSNDPYCAPLVDIVEMSQSSVICVSNDDEFITDPLPGFTFE
jgi:hypothetical protein